MIHWIGDNKITIPRGNFKVFSPHNLTTYFQSALTSRGATALFTVLTRDKEHGPTKRIKTSFENGLAILSCTQYDKGDMNNKPHYIYAC